MEIEVASSPGSLSSPPHSPEQSSAPNSTIKAFSTPVPVSGVGVGAAGSPTPASTPRLTASGQPRRKPGPKPKPKDPNAPEKKPRKPRKPAEPKDPNAEPAPRKRRTKASLEAQSVPPPSVDEKPAHLQQQQPIPVTQQTRPVEVVSVPLPEQPRQPVVAQTPHILNNPEPITTTPIFNTSVQDPRHRVLQAQVNVMTPFEAACSSQNPRARPSHLPQYHHLSIGQAHHRPSRVL